MVIVDADTGNYLGGTGNSDARTGNFTCQYPKSSLDEVFGTHTYHDGEQWWPDKAFERERVEPEQEARFEVDAWEENISTYLDTASRVTIGQVAREALSIDVPRLGRAEQNRISGALQRLGWKRELKKDWQGKRWWSR